MPGMLTHIDTLYPHLIPLSLFTGHSFIHQRSHEESQVARLAQEHQRQQQQAERERLEEVKQIQRQRFQAAELERAAAELARRY